MESGKSGILLIIKINLNIPILDGNSWNFDIIILENGLEKRPARK